MGLDKGGGDQEDISGRSVQLIKGNNEPRKGFSMVNR